MILSFFVKVFLLQLIAIACIIFILKKILDHKLIEEAIRRLEIALHERRPQQSSPFVVKVISHKKLANRYKLKILKVTIKYLGENLKPSFETDRHLWGGLIVKLGDIVVDCSLKERIREAFPF